MDIRNEDHAHEMLKEWQALPPPAMKREIKLALDSLELSIMYYEQKDNEKGILRAKRCISLLQDHLTTLEKS